MSAAEQIILTVSENGYGKRTSSYEYRITGRGGKGIVAMAVNERNGKLVASMPVEDGDGIMLVTNGGQLIRCPSTKSGCGPRHSGRDRLRYRHRRTSRRGRTHYRGRIRAPAARSRVRRNKARKTAVEGSATECPRATPWT